MALLTPGTPLGAGLTELAELDADAPFVTCDGESVTRAEMDSLANRLARSYAELGVDAGDLAVVCLPNGVEFFAACFALWKLGAVPLPLSSRLPARERDAIIGLSQCSLIIGAEESNARSRAHVPAGFRPDESLSDSPHPPRISPAWKAMTSGGSTGRPKIIVAGRPGVVEVLRSDVYRVQDNGCTLVPGPLYHNSPFSSAMRGAFSGNHVVVLPRFSEMATLRAIESYGVDFVVFVPTMMIRILRALDGDDSFDLSSLSSVWHMAAPCPEWLKRAWIDLLGPERLFELYSCTEGQAFTVIDGVEWLRHPGSVGRAAYGEIKIFDATGVAAASGEVGEVFLRRPVGDAPTYRYIGAEVKRLEDWESVGDMGSMDEGGYLYLTTRSADMIISGGANIYPAEVEGALLEHPLVESCAIVGVPDDDMGQIVHAIVHAVEDVRAEDLQQHLDTRLVRYKVPRSWEFVEDPVLDDAGKVRRSQLAEAASLRHRHSEFGATGE
ncbi:MAG TPA: AMP-binding protein [Acidimicrobiales bacterium]|jgi:bile acid-coenzyme A ligase|nr:AMP-binding protein [Acidimicrobiales bacterium]